MIDDIRNWLGDIASGKIKDAQLALTKEQALTFQQQLLDTQSKLSTTEKSLASAQIEINYLRDQLTNVPKPIYDIPEPQSKALKLLHNGDRISVEQLAKSIGISVGDMKFHLYELRKVDCVDIDMGKSFNVTKSRRMSLGYYYIKQKGRELVIAQEG